MLKKELIISEELIVNFIKQLEQLYTEKDEEQFTELFHPDQRNISFLNHFQMQMLFQIYNITSEILEVKVLEIFSDEAIFAYTRKHIYTCINNNDEREEKLNNITSYYVKVVLEDNSLLITKYSPYSIVYLDKKGQILPSEAAVVPEQAQFFKNMQRFIKQFQLDNYQPATYKLYSDSEFIGYYLKDEFYHYYTSDKFTIDYFEEMNAESIGEHTQCYLEQELELGKIIEETDQYSIIETKFKSETSLNHELLLSMLAPDGFFMIRYQKNNQTINLEERTHWIRQMKLAVKEIGND